ncbi:xylulokinase [Ohessyouella blattaphilus]|uniref:Xylulose kinase n=1 Tax=Ohessyouella blattaphilus TaxID=2949333 RepID=A0ABT1EI61_9FIRM|nr:xylulokinase [Ohessyouella blattaphilus]MCP1110164.1 xylulokinase [Ohessyouella blattaphilus]MCR8563558.1 xylulokinase [Ohessyouella blattaphilus]
MNKLFGVDFGTGGCKATVIDLDGNICATAFKEYPSEHSKPGWSEQDPALWIDAFITTVTKCREQMTDGFEGVLGLAVTASTHNAVLLDSKGEVIRRCIMWNDQRSVEQSNVLREQYGERIYEIGMQMPTPTWTLPQLMWIRDNEPENYEKIDKLMFTKDYVRSWVTGDFCTDVVDAQGSLLYDAIKKEWSPELCGMIGLPLEVLPEIRGSQEIVGKVRAEIAELTGLPEGLAVIAGCSDTAAEDFSAGAVREGQIIVKLATAGNVNLVTNSAKPHPKSFTYPYSVAGKWYTVTATNSCASANRWMRDALYPVEKELAEQAGEDIYEIMSKQAEEVELGAQGLIFHPYLLGERCPHFNSHARGNFFGISMMHTKGHFARALLEGVAFSLYDCLQVLKDFTENMEDIVIIGGGAKSALWSQIVSDIFGLEVKQPENAESSFGGALMVGVGVGAFASEEEAARRCVRMKKTYQPNAENHHKYMRIFEIYKKIVKASEPIWEELAELS